MSHLTFILDRHCYVNLPSCPPLHRNIQVQEVQQDLRRLSDDVRNLTRMVAGRMGGGGGGVGGGGDIGGIGAGRDGFDRSYRAMSPGSPRLGRGAGLGFRVFDT